MQEPIDNFLKRIYNLPELKKNLFAWILAKYSSVDFGSRDKLFNSVFPLYQKHFGEDLTEIEFVDLPEDFEQEERDFRVQKISISNIRGFPKSEIPYGIEFVENDEIKNAVILGANGIGKSSIFTALEYVYGGKIGEALLRNQEDFKDYISRNNAPFLDCHFKIETNNGNYDIQSPIFEKIDTSQVNPDSHFISDYDIYKNGQLNYSGNPNDSASFHYLIASSLGLQDLMNFNEVINQLSFYKRLKETKARNEYVANKDKYLKEIENLEKEVSIKETRLKSLFTEQKETENTEEKKKRDNLELINNLKTESLGSTYGLSNLSPLIESFYFDFAEFDKIKISDSSQSEIEFLSQGLKLISDHDIKNCPFCQNSELSIENIKSNVSNRISAFKEYNDLYKNLTSTFSRLVENIDNVYSQTRIIKDYIDKEIEKIATISELFPLLEEERKFSSLINSYLNNEFYTEAINVVQSSEPVRERFSRLNKIIDNNESFLNEIDITKEIENFNKIRSELLNKGEELLKQKIAPKTNIEERIVLNSDIKRINEQIQRNRTAIQNFDKEIEKLNITINQVNKLITETNSYKTVVSKVINETVNKYFEPISDITVSILSDYLKNDDVKIEIDRETIIDDETGEILSEIIKAKLKHKDYDFPLSPNKYFNTFRYRLFCMMVSVSIAAASRLKTKINFPIVLDDVFYASDFSKRTTIEKFLSNLLKLLKKYFKEMPLQLILFTHDELIFDSAINAISNTEFEKQTIFSKLLHYSESEPIDGILKLNYNMPTKLPQSILHLFK